MGDKKYILTFPQQNIWLMEKYNEGTAINSITGLINISKDFNSELCEKAINYVLKNNDVMRTRIIENSGLPLQYFEEYKYNNIEIVDMTSYSQEEISEYIDAFALHSLFFDSNQFYEFKILKYKNNKGGILLKIHHIISDAWSCSKLAMQLIDYIESNGNISEDNKNSYVDFINSQEEYLKSDKYVADEAFWKEYLSDINKTISMKNHNKIVSHNANRYSVSLDKYLNDRIINYCNVNKISVYSLFLAVISAYLFRTTNQTDFVIGTPVLNRANFKEKNTLGMFVSTIPLRVKIDENETILDLAKSISKNTMTIFRHQRYPYNKMLDIVRDTTANKDNLYNISFSYQNARINLNPEKYSTLWTFNKQLNDELQIHVTDMDNTGILRVNYDYLEDLFSENEIVYIHKRFLRILSDVVNYNYKILDIDILCEEEKIQIREYNNTDAKYSLNETVIDLLEEKVKYFPNDVALIYENQKISYKDFYNMVCNFAFKLLNVSDEKIIVYLDNSIELIVAIYGILMSGNAYVPLNLSTPVDRVRTIANDCDCKYAVMQDKILDDVIYLDVEKDTSTKINIENKSTHSKLAYIIYTSGSTGTPKGVKITNRALTNYICWAKKVYVNDSKPLMPLYSSIAFDLTVTTLYLPIISGGTIVICKNNNEEIVKIFREDKVNIVKLTPAHLSLINEANIRISNINTLILGGEALKTNDVKKIVKRSRRSIRIFNEYGPTEATVGCMIYKYNALDSEPTLPIGKPADNVKIYVMDKYGNICPLGVEGEIYIEGDGISAGYNNMEEKTKQSFILNSNTNRIMYKTGDIGRLDLDMQLRYIGRKDKQIKINGNRIELEEIENIAKKQFKFKNVVVDVKYISNIPNICLYYVSKNEYRGSYIRGKLKNYLPYYMLPSKYVKIDFVPVNKNGKVVRDLLPIPKKDVDSSLDKIRYINEFEENVCKVWEEILGKSVDPKHSIFDYGVDSLNIIRCQVKLSKYTKVINVQKFYEYPIIREFCKHINEMPKDETNLEELKKYKYINYSKPKTEDNFGKNIILVGATGFLGIHILKELLTINETDIIYCIVRGIDFEKRLRNRFKFYFGNEFIGLYEEKVKVINGNIEQENFGLQEDELLNIVKNTNRLINAAAIVKHHGYYSEFDLINVQAVKNIVKICKAHNLILEHISTVSIAGDSSIEVFDESKFYIGQNYKINPYIETKFKAELYIYKMISEQNLMANVYRIGNLTWRYVDGVYQKNVLNNGFFMRIKNMLFLKAYPSSIKNMKVEMTPVDIAAKFIISLMFYTKEVNQIFHIYNPNTVNFLDMIYSLDIAKGSEFRELSDNDFMEILKKYDSRENVLLNDIISSMGTIEVQIDNKYTIKKLNECKQVWPNLDKNYINKMSIYLNKFTKEEFNGTKEKIKLKNNN